MPDSVPATFKPALIIHGGAGNIQRSRLPPDLYAQYHASLLSYLRSTKDLLNSGASALDAAVHAVSLLEDDELFNCGRGSVFTSAGTIEMEASVMVTTVNKATDDAMPIPIKRGAGVMGLRNVRHPIQLARECLLRTGHDANGDPNGDGGNMHSQLVAPYVEELARAWGLEFKPDEWFWTKRRWEEHRRGLRGEAEPVSMSQGTVGCVSLDRWGNLAVATSTGGRTNKLPGRIGDTPTLGAGFWAEAWEEVLRGGERGGMVYRSSRSDPRDEEDTSPGTTAIRRMVSECVPPVVNRFLWPDTDTRSPSLEHSSEKQALLEQESTPRHVRRRAVALSGTGNGDSFLRVAAARTACAMLRYSQASAPHSLAEAVSAVAGPDGELQRSAGRRWGKTGEGEGGIIGIEAETVLDATGAGLHGELKKGLSRGKVVFDFNCGGMWRAWVEEDATGKDVERVMVFREEYQ
ncbi:putative isoaspartyl peptidase/L-asparaginase [Aspergillus lentulus]|uniref:Isoaspartyl peptidase/L-asparaginase n=1 Tax=Aspergillus lentulus TaxID=293939 RepID=A0ABQ1AF26_ASPLE|nr:putative isoaspartyl peptidase/L-asparaginase [Aspergillus lentulus]GFF39111.1 putative isoaspartyl peptidase/L-asparaginase [Aspergillus lentulus]GFF62440.1 putative isoaspartyl peptidase/L-asparaginase [Aspergillus lentulus]GFF80583.1 putative isoaspartyl peptidase/L-asparaginase [Aspergillus lentulus]GFF81809.1 putative isoaspartyl peptidase/L-asparaginase [Aspergillus lentulus]GFG08808.1 putative isoaspartyl peptidase/L-asparaginase [Aspergillus lentulus]